MTTPTEPEDRNRWPMHEDWAKTVPGYRWHRRWRDRGADVVRRDHGASWPVKLYNLDEDRRPIGEPRLIGVFRSEIQAKFVADTYLGAPRPAGVSRPTKSELKSQRRDAT